jgi:hypothetical protein
MNEQTKTEIQEAAMQFRIVADRLGVKSFLFVMLPGSVQRFYDSNLVSLDPAFHYLSQAVTTDMTLKQEMERWKHFVLGNKQTFEVICSNNLEVESYLERGKRYCVVSVLFAVDGYCFVLTDEDGKWVHPPENNAGFHSSRFNPDVMKISMN